MIQLPYINEYGTETVTRNGYKVISNVDHYKDATIRDKIVIRIDLIAALNDCFSVETLSKFRDVLFMIVAGSITEPDSVGGALHQLYHEDRTFRRYFGGLYYFEQEEMLSVYDMFIKSIKTKFEEHETTLKTRLKDIGCKYLFTSSGYMYFVTAGSRTEICLPKGYKGELVSSAKIWYGFTEESS